MQKTQPFEAGHMKSGGLILPHTSDRNKSLSRAAYKANAIKKLKPVQLNWKPQGDKRNG